jgi:hypothetical protein
MCGRNFVVAVQVVSGSILTVGHWVTAALIAVMILIVAMKS